jgi:hypothetical protein
MATALYARGVLELSNESDNKQRDRSIGPWQ